MKVKVCGLKNPENIDQLLNLSIDWLGFIFYEKSLRKVNYEELSKWITDHSNKFNGKKRVGVFVNHPMEFILNASGDFGLDYAQLHGDESLDYLRELTVYKSVLATGGFELIKAVSGTQKDLNVLAEQYAPYCKYLLIDTKTADGSFGGTGVKFDWKILDDYRGPIPFFLSGGIGPMDVETILKINHPLLAGVDLNSQFETAKGIKDPQLLKGFIEKIKD
ncbi:MAG: phosphoribosylanthranilate isomerase [Saprospiraceae bacterium]|jgi:phosphoribosylanthranilate isomerase